MQVEPIGVQTPIWGTDDHSEAGRIWREPVEQFVTSLVQLQRGDSICHLRVPESWASVDYSRFRTIGDKGYQTLTAHRPRFP